jgi:hypothetical protein
MYHDLQHLCPEYTSSRELTSLFTLLLTFLASILDIGRGLYPATHVSSFEGDSPRSSKTLESLCSGKCFSPYPSALKGGGVVGLWEVKDAIGRRSKRSKNLDVNANEVI